MSARGATALTLPHRPRRVSRPVHCGAAFTHQRGEERQAAMKASAPRGIVGGPCEATPSKSSECQIVHAQRAHLRLDAATLEKRVLAAHHGGRKQIMFPSRSGEGWPSPLQDVDGRSTPQCSHLSSPSGRRLNHLSALPQPWSPGAVLVHDRPGAHLSRLSG